MRFHPILELFLAVAPILLLFHLILRAQPMPSAKALPLAAGVAYGIRLIGFGSDPNQVHAAILEGLLMALTPILIVWGAIFLFRTMELSGAMATLRLWLNQLSTNRVAQVVLIGWSFQFLIEGASGFGTPAALAAPLLVGLGFPPIRVAMACLILNSVPVSFGAVGTPTWFGFAQLGLTPLELRQVAWKTALIHSVAAGFIPLLAFRLLLSTAEIRRNLRFIALALAASVVPMFLLSFLDGEFPAVAGGLIGLLVTVGLARHQVGLAPAGTLPHRESAAPSATRDVIKAMFPLWGTVLILLLTRIPQLGLRGLLNAASPSLDLPLGSLGQLSISPALVVRLRDIFHTDTQWSHPFLYVPSLIPFILVSFLTLRLLDAPTGTARSIWRESADRMRHPIPALFGALILVRLLMVGGEDSSVMLIGRSLAAWTGGSWQYLAAYLGALGSFFSGSCTVSNLTFGPIQDSIASRLGLERTTLLALQSVGGAMGNMVAIHNIIAVCSVLGLGHQEGTILRRTIGPMLLYGLVPAVIGRLL